MRTIGWLVRSVSLTSSVVCVFAEAKEVFDLFDFWDGRDGMVDGAKIGDFLRCCKMNPTNAVVLANGGVEKMGSSRTCFLPLVHLSFLYFLTVFFVGEKQYKFEEILPIYKAVSSDTDVGKTEFF